MLPPHSLYFPSPSPSSHRFNLLCCEILHTYEYLRELWFYLNLVPSISRRFFATFLIADGGFILGMAKSVGKTLRILRAFVGKFLCAGITPMFCISLLEALRWHVAKWRLIPASYKFKRFGDKSYSFCLMRKKRLKNN